MLDSKISNSNSTKQLQENILYRSNMERSFAHTDYTLDEMSNSSWVTEYGENIKESVSSNLS